MRIETTRRNKFALFAWSVLFFCAVSLCAQEKTPDGKGNSGAASKDVHLTIVVTGGEDKKPVENASVYVKFVESHVIAKNKKIEMNLKTNQSGMCHVPPVPAGKFLIQIIAPGWKTYGEYYDVAAQDEQTVGINLMRPPKWY